MDKSGISNSIKTVSTDYASKREDDQADSNNVFRFLDLPPELRDATYHCLLKARNEIRISRHLNKTNRGLKKYFTKDRRVGYVLKGITMSDWKGKSRKRWVSEEHPLAILLVSRALKAEAAPVFYGTNKFSFEAPCALSEFKDRTGSHFRLLKHVNIKSIPDGARTRLGSALRCLGAGTHVTIGGFLRTDYHPTIEVEAKWLCAVLRLFVTERWEWHQDKSGKGGLYKLASKLDDAKRQQRLDSLYFVAKPGVTIRSRDGTLFKADKEEDLHEVIKGAFLKVWECEEQARIKKADDDLRKLKELGVK